MERKYQPSGQENLQFKNKYARGEYCLTTIRGIERLSDQDLLDTLQILDPLLQQEIEDVSNYKSQYADAVWIVEVAKLLKGDKPVLKDFAQSVLVRNLDRIDREIGEGKDTYWTDPNEDNDPGIPASAVCYWAVSTLFRYGLPEFQKPAGKILAKNIGTFIQDMRSGSIPSWYGWVLSETTRNVLDFSQIIEPEDQGRLLTVFNFASLFERNRQKHYSYLFIAPARAISHWAGRYLDGALSEEELDRVGQKVPELYSEYNLILREKEEGRQLHNGTNEIIAAKLADFFIAADIVNLSKEDIRKGDEKMTEFIQALVNNLDRVEFALIELLLKEMGNGRDLLSNLEDGINLVNKGILPTGNIPRYLKENGSRAIVQLQEIQQEISKGKFDPNNIIHRDLQLAKLTGLVSFRNINNIRDYLDQLEFVSDPEAPLGENELKEAEVCSYEASLLYWFIQKRTEMGRRVIVLGNERYGYLFVTQPLRMFLEDLRVPLRWIYVHSSGNTNGSEAEVFKRLLGEHFDDLVIIDGSRNFLRNTVRLPSSFNTFEQWITAINDSGDVQYSNSHWVPFPKEDVVIGSGTPKSYKAPTLQSPQIIFANPVIPKDSIEKLPDSLQDHIPGFFDDPENHFQGEIKLTRYGVEKIIKYGSNYRYIGLVQEAIESTLPSMVSLTKPD